MAYPKSPAQALTFSALMAALSVLLYFSAGFLPIIGLFARFALGLPVALVAVITKSEPYALGSGLIASLLIGLFFGPTAAIHYAGVFALAGLVMGLLLNRGAGSLASVAWSFLAGIVGSLIYYGAMFMLTGMDLNTMTESIWAIKDDVIAMYEESGFLDSLDQQGLNARAEFLALVDQAFRSMVLFTPSFLFAALGLQIAAQYGLTLYILRLSGRPTPAIKAFRQWHIPFPFAIPFILAWMLFLFRDMLPWAWLEPLVLNVLLLGGMLAVLNGLAWIVYRIRPERLGTGTKILLLVAFFIFFYGFVIFAGLIGLFDMLIDLRDRQKNMKE